MKADDWSKNCVGDIDAYSECGTFALMFVAPFFALAAFLVLTWVAVRVALRGVKAAVPHDAKSWRRKAHEMANSMRTAREGVSVNGTRGASLGTEGMWAELSNRRSEAVYDPNVFVANQVHAPPVAPPMSYFGHEGIAPTIGAVETPASYIPAAEVWRRQVAWSMVNAS